MSKQIDQRVVQMQFDNAQFEKGIKQTTDSLKKFKDELEFGNSAKSLKSLGKSINSVDVSSLNDAIKTITERFSTMGMIGASVINNLTTRFTNMAISMVKSLSVDQISSGFSKYEQKVNSVRTISNATGESVDQVSTKLQKLQDYTDETSYRYNEMIGAIANFTSANQTLDSSIDAVMGIANAAALAGVGTTSATSAFTNFSQAMSKGFMKYDDWQSIEGLNMATKQLKQAFIDAAVAQGTLKKKGDKYYTTTGKKLEVTTANFAQTLSKEWLTASVLSSGLSTLADNTQGVGQKAYKAAQEAKTYTDAMEAIKEAVSSGWSESFEEMFGNVDEASKMWTGFCNTIISFIEPISEARNNLLHGWAIGGGKGQIGEALDKLWNIVEGIKEVIDEVVVDFGLDVKTEDLLNLSKGFNTFAQALQNWLGIEWEYEETVGDDGKIEKVRTGVKSLNSGLQTFKDILSGVAVVFKFVMARIGELWDGIKDLASAFAPIISVFQTIISDISQLLTGYDKTEKKTSLFKTAITAIVNFLKPIIQSIGPMLTSAWASIKSFLQNLNKDEILSKVSKAISDFVVKASAWITKAVGVINSLWESFKNSETAQKIIQGITAAFESFKNICVAVWKAVSDFFEGIFGKKEKSGTQKTIEDTSSAIQTFLSGSWEKLKKAFESAKKFFKPLTDALKPVTDQLTKFFSGFMADPLKWITEKYNALKEKLEPYIQVIESYGTKIGNAVKNFFKDPQKAMQNLAKKLKNFFKDPMSQINKWISSLKKWAGNVWNKILQAIKSIFGSEKKQNKDLKEAVSTKNSTSLFKTISDALSKTWNWLSTTFGNISQVIGKFVNNYGTWVAVIAVIVSVIKLFKTIRQLIKGLTRLTKSVTKFFNTKTNQQKQKNKQKFVSIAAGILLIALSIAILAQSLSHLGSMKPKELEQGAKALAGIAGGLLAFVVIASLLTKNKKNDKTSNSMLQIGIGLLAIAVAVAILIKCIEDASKLDLDTLAKGGTVVAVILLALSGVAITIAQAGNGGSLGAAAEIIAMAIAVWIIVKTLKPLANFEWQQLGKMGASMAVLTFCIAKLAEVAGKSTSQTSKTNLTGLANVLAIAIAIKWIVAALKPLAKMSWEQLGKMGAALGGLTIAISAMLGLSAWMTKESGGKTNLTAFITILAIAILVWELSEALKQVQNVKMEIILSFCGGLSAMLLMAAILVKSANKISGKGIAALIIVFAGLIGIMLVAANCIKELKGTSWEVIVAFLGGISVSLILMAAAVKMLGQLDPATIAKGEVAVLALGVVLSAIIGLVSDAVSQAIVEVSSALSLAGGSISDFISEVKNIQESDWKPAYDLLTAFFSLITTGIPSSQQIQNFQSFAAAFTIVGITMSIGLSALKNVGLSKSDVDAITYAVDEFAKMMTSSNLPTTEQAEVFRTVMGKLRNSASELKNFASDMKNSGITKETAGSLTEGIEALFTFMTGNSVPSTNQAKQFNAACYKLRTSAGHLKNFTDEMAKLNDGNITKTGTVLGALGDSSSGISSLINMNENGNLEKLGGALSTLSGAVMLYSQAFNDDVPEANEEATDNAIAILQMLVNKLDNSGLASGIASSQSTLPSDTDLGTFSAQLAALGGAIQSYATSVSGIKLGDLATSFLALTIISGFYGKLSTITNTTKGLNEASGLSSFNQNISELGMAISDYAGNVTDIDEGDVKLSGYVLDIVSGFYTKMTAIQGTLSGLEGATGLSNFDQNIKDIGVAIGDYSKNIEGISFLKVLASGFALDMLAGINLKIGTIQSVCQVLGVPNALGDFANQMVQLGGGLSGYYQAVQNIDVSKIMDTKDPLQMLASVYNSLPLVGGIAGILNGDPNLSAFSIGLESLGGALYKFYEKVKSIDDPSKAQAAADVAKTLAEMNAALPETGGLMRFIVGDEDLSEFTSKIGPFGEGLVAFVNGCAGIEEGNLPKAERAVAMIVPLVQALASAVGSYTLSDFGEDLTDQFNDRTDLATNMKTFIGNLSDVELGNAPQAVQLIADVLSVVQGVDKYNTDGVQEQIKQLNALIQYLAGIDFSPLNPAGKVAGTSYASGVYDGIVGSKETVSKAVQDIADSLTEKKLSFFNAGNYTVAGFINALRSSNNIVKAAAAGKAVAEAAYNAACKFLGIASPSKLFGEVGMYADEGFANGLRSYSGIVGDSSEDVAETAVDTAKSALGKVSSLLGNEIGDDTLTIRPVLDLSNIEAGSSQISSLLNGQNGISVNGVDATLTASNAMVASAGFADQFNSQDIVNSINEIGDRLDALTDNFANLQVVLDTGVLAGQLTDRIDEGIGQNIIRKGRGG